MRFWQFTSRYLASGLAISAAIVAAGNLSAQDTQVTTVSAKRAALAEPLLLDLPSTVLDEEPSPSDLLSSKAIADKDDSKSGTASKKEDDSKNDKDKADESSRKDKGEKDSDSSKDPKKKDSLAPMQNRELSTKVQVATISAEKIGTGLIPQRSSDRNAAQGPLPTGLSRGMIHTHVHWRASHIQHYPLYFENAMLERHGHTRSFFGYEYAQSIISGTKFFVTIPLLPYHETLRSKHQCVYALGHYRAGSGAPCLRDNIPYDSRAAIVESASAAAFFWAIPL